LENPKNHGHNLKLLESTWFLPPGPQNIIEGLIVDPSFPLAAPMAASGGSCGGIWWLLWRPLAAPVAASGGSCDGLWRLLWRPLAAPGGLWRPLGAPGGSWRPGIKQDL